MIDRADLDHVLSRTESLWEPLRGERLFVTGGTGFVGKWLIESFLDANRALRLRSSAVLLTRNPEAFRSRAPHLANDPAIVLLRGDQAAFERPSGTFAFVIHAATERYFEPDRARPFGTYDADVTATRHVLELAATAGTQRLLFVSSGAVYGRQPPQVERLAEDFPGAPYTTDANPVAIYGHGKRTSEWLCVMLGRQNGLVPTIGRLFTFVGPYLPLDEQYAIGNFLGNVLARRPVRVAGDGTPYRSYLYGADLAIWLWTIFFRGEAGRPYNVGSPEAVSIRVLAEAVAANTVPGTPIDVARDRVPGAPPARYVPDTSRAENELGLRVAIPLDEAIRRTYRWHRTRAEG